VKIRSVGEIVEGDRAEVRARLLGRKTQDVTVDARLVRRGDRWLVYDVAIGGVSLAGNFRSQFTKTIQDSSYDALVQRIEKKLAEDQ